MPPKGERIDWLRAVFSTLLVVLGFIAGFYSISAYSSGDMSRFYILLITLILLITVSLFLELRTHVHRKELLAFFLFLAIIGLGVAGYQSYEHYSLSASVCDVSSNFSCSTVTESRFGEFPQDSGIALSNYGIVWWLGLIFLLSSQIWNWGTPRKADLYTLSWNLIGFLTILPLLWIELYTLPQEIGKTVICPLCTIQHILIVIIFALSFFILKKPISSYIRG